MLLARCADLHPAAELASDRFRFKVNFLDNW